MNVHDAVFIVNTQMPDLISSIRLMAIIPGRYLGMRVLYFGAKMDPTTFLDRHQPKLIVLTKTLNTTLIALAQMARARNIKVVTILCDYHFEGQKGQINQQLCDLSDEVVVQTVPMSDAVKKIFGRDCRIIEEVIEYPRVLPALTAKDEWSILWFGHSSNYDTLAHGLNVLFKENNRKIKLDILSNHPPDFIQPNVIPKNFSITFDFWSLDRQLHAMRDADILFIPSIDMPEKNVKGHNRLVEAINAGKATIVHPLPQYKELQEYCYCNADYVGALNELIANPQHALEKLKKGQAYLDQRFSLEAIAKKWHALFKCY